MILVKTWLEHASYFSVGSPSGVVVVGALVECMFFQIFCICTFPVVMDGGI